MTTKTKTIRTLNDELHQNLTVGTAVAEGRDTGCDERNCRSHRYRHVRRVCHANDPSEEHDFGSFEIDGQTIFFKIDLYEEPGVNTAKWRTRRQPC
jgi:Protein of unknown function (DUF3768)